MTSTSEILHLPPGLNYECVQCGLSCHMYDEIYVDEETQEEMQAMELADLLPSEIRSLPLLLPGISRPERRIMRKHDGHCAMLQDHKLCGIHSRYGYDAKPGVCQNFPYRYVETEEGIYAGLSFACTAVLENRGPSVESQREDMRASHGFNHARLDTSEAVMLSSRHEISREAYTLIEEDLATILATSGRAFGARLVAQSVYIDILTKFLREVRGDSVVRNRTTSPPGGRSTFPANHGGTRDTEVVEAFRRKYVADTGMDGLFRLAGTLKPSPALQRAFIGLVTAFRQNLKVEKKQANRVSAVISIVRHYVQHATKLGRVNLLPLEGRYDYEAFRRIPFEPDSDGEILELLQRYFAHMLFRKDLLLSESVWLGQRMMLMHYALIRWHSTGRATLDAKSRVDLQSVREAVRGVENHYLFHTRMSQLFSKFPSLGIILDAIVSKPLFPTSMIGSPV